MTRSLHATPRVAIGLALAGSLPLLVALLCLPSCATDERGRPLTGFVGGEQDAAVPVAPVCDDGAARPGCPCEPEAEGTRVSCGVVESIVAGQVTCGRGESVCTGGLWAECVVNNASLLPYDTHRSLGAPAVCLDNPCDPYCHTFVDDPGGLGAPDDGVVEGDGGLTLPLGDGGAWGEPEECTGGDVGGCAHHMCALGGPLSPGCEPGPAPPGSLQQTAFEESFANNSQGWTLGTEWAIGSATQSGARDSGYRDPAQDHTPTADNSVAGVVIGGNASRSSTHDYYWLTSPAVDLTGLQSPVTLQFQRWLNSDRSPYMNNRVEIYDGSGWVTIWQSGNSYVRDSSWTLQTFDVSSYAHGAFRVRFGHRVGSTSCDRVSSWNLDDVTITGMVPALPAAPSCVAQICGAEPSCCATAWTASCVARVATTCGAECANMAGSCVTCYGDAYDHDLDGYSTVQGDGLDCDPAVNPGAYDIPGNGVDEDCNGVADDEPADCGASLAMASDNPWDYVKAVDLCRVQVDPNAEGAARTWGVTDAALVGANGAASVHALSKGIHTRFGTNNVPFQGANMAVFSSGSARAPGDTGYVNPNGAGLDQGNSCAYPAGFPQNASGCPNSSGSAYDSTGLAMTIRVPTNAHSFSYNFSYFSSEYPEWVCTAYNDHFVALMAGSQHTGNISFDANGNAVSVNIGFFTIPGCPASTCTHSTLTATGFDGSCLCPTSGSPHCTAGSYNICGGSTGWLYTTAPVTPGETMTIRFSTWDQGDHKWDSTVLLDNWTWSVNAASVETGVQPPAPAPPHYSDGWFSRVYDTTDVCPDGTAPVWTFWSWTAETPADSSVAFHVTTAPTVGDLSSASEVPLRFSDPPGPSALAGDRAVAQAAVVPDTQAGSAVVDETLRNEGLSRSEPVLRVRSHLIPSADGLSAPTLQAWNLQFDCMPDE